MTTENEETLLRDAVRRALEESLNALCDGGPGGGMPIKPPVILLQESTSQDELTDS